MKDPLALLSAPWLHERFHMEVVVVVRHPAAFAGSLKRSGRGFPFEDLLGQDRLMATHLGPFRAEIEAMAQNPGTVVEQAALLWTCLYHVVGEYRERYPGWHVVRHEDLARNPTTEYRRLYGQMELPWTPKLGASIERRTSVDLGSWRRRLDSREVEQVRQETQGVWEAYYREAEWETELS